MKTTGMKAVGVMLVMAGLVTVLHAKTSATAEKRAAALKANIEQFELQLWPSLANVDKPYYALTLTCTPVPEGNDRSNSFVKRVQISKDEATKIIDYLATEGFLENAVEYDSRAKTKRPFQEGYHLRVSGYAEHQVLTEHWGWNRDLVRRLDALRTVLDGNAGKAMDFLIGRLAAMPLR